MRIPSYILPVFVSANLLAENHSGDLPPVSFGFSHFVFNSLSFKPTSSKLILNNELSQKEKVSKLTEIQYGFGIGFFFWAPLNENIIYKPKIEATFSNSYLKQPTPVFATSFDMSVTQSFAISLKSDDHGIIYMARNMSCYLTIKQPYLLLGPKINVKKYDCGYLNKGYKNELNVGFLIGYGINYEFHGTNFAPEITYCVSSTSQNKIGDSNKIAHTISLALNFF